MKLLVTAIAQKQSVPRVIGMLRLVNEHVDLEPATAFPKTAGANEQSVSGTTLKADPPLLHTRLPSNVIVVPMGSTLCVITNDPTTLAMIPLRPITCEHP
jgi:hypothetical protein